MTALWLTIAIVALAAHEYFVSCVRLNRLGRFGGFIFRHLLLAVVLLSAWNVGPAIVEQARNLTPSRQTPPLSFVADGDASFTDALARQQPKWPFPSGRPAAEVEAWRRRIVQALRDDAGVALDVPESVPLKVLNSEMVGDIRRSLVTFTSWDGTTIPAYIHAQDGSSPKAAVLVIAGHGDGIVATAGLVDDYQHSAALALARQGYVTMAPELRGFGLLGLGGKANHQVVAAAALEAGSSYKAIVLRDLGWAVTALGQWPGVDARRIAVAGGSLGGELAVTLGALDERIQVVMSSSYGGRTGPVTVDQDFPDDLGQSPHGCHTIPGANQILHQEDWARLIAPRALLVIRGSRNTPDGVELFEKAVSETYLAYAAADRFVLSIEPGGHEFYVEPSVHFLARWL